GAGVAVNSDGSVTRSLLVRLAHQKSINKEILSKVGFMPDSTYGSQLSSHGTGTIKPEGQLTVEYEMIVGKYPDGLSYTLRKPIYSIQNLAYGAFDKETIIAPRIGSALVGLGLLERISEKDLLKNEDINDENRDGISGKANYTFDPETNTTLLGRFTWKASATSIKHQSAAAAHNDMGLSNPLFPTDNCSDKQIACQEVSKSKQKELYALDLPQHRLDAITFYLQNLAVPKQREIGKHKEGEALFEHLSCVKCHVSNFTTTDGVKINPYSDLLLHNMGEALADGRSEFLATGTEWRTAPLWGIGLRQKVSGEANFLHDGRARTIEEAILWHGGEAQKSKEAFMQLSKKQREKLLLFLQTI
ncbi:MAG TPA: thiol oxidoreductase, partial [Epsilonproteobacteria bacterium]|nr:thiol oxidoreductase [Campylobacterota bacterium]